MMKRLFLFLTLACAALIPAAGRGAQAATFDMKNVQPLKYPDFLPKAEFEARTDLYKEDPNNDPKIEYAVRLPKGWTEEKGTGVLDAPAINTLSSTVMQRVARYVSPARMHRRSYLLVESQELTYEIGARNWFINYFQNSGYSLEGITGGEDSNRVVEASYVELVGDVTYAVRAKTIVNGPRVVMARYYVPVELFNEERVIQAQSISSFELTGERVERIEELRTHGFLDQAYFDFPVSWRLSAPKVVYIDRMRAMIYNPGPSGQMTGQINLYLTSRHMETTLAEEVRLYKEKLDIPDYKIGGRIEQMKIPVHKDMQGARTEVYALTPTRNFMQYYELWITVMQSEGYYYIITMLSPAREADFYQWSRNVRAYEIVLRSTRQFDPTIDKYQFSETGATHEPAREKDR